MPETLITGVPGLRTAKTATPRLVFKQGYASYLAQGRLIDGTKSGDPGNTGDIDVLRPGTLMGKITSSSNYAPSVMGVLTVAFTAGGTTMTVSAPTATELNRRVGGSGTFKLVGPPAAAGAVATITVTYSAVNVTTGVITLTDPGVNFISGSLVCPTDGSENMLSFVPDGYGIKVTDTDNTTRITVEYPDLPIGGTITSSQLLPWPTDTSLQNYIVAHLNAAAQGQFVFDHGY